MLLGYTNTEFEDVIYECGDGNVFVFFSSLCRAYFQNMGQTYNGKVKFLILKIWQVTFKKLY